MKRTEFYCNLLSQEMGTVAGPQWPLKRSRPCHLPWYRCSIVEISWWNRSPCSSLTALNSQERSPTVNLGSGSSMTYGSPLFCSFSAMCLLTDSNFQSCDSLKKPFTTDTKDFHSGNSWELSLFSKMLSFKVF